MDARADVAFFGTEELGGRESPNFMSGALAQGVNGFEDYCDAYQREFPPALERRFRTASDTERDRANTAHRENVAVARLGGHGALWERTS